MVPVADVVPGDVNDASQDGTPSEREVGSADELFGSGAPVDDESGPSVPNDAKLRHERATGGRSADAGRTEPTGDGTSSPAERPGSNGSSTDTSSSLAELEEVLEAIPEELRGRAATSIAALVSRSESFSGMLPPPDLFRQYPVHVQDRMMSWNDAFTVDESARQDRLVDAEIAQARRGPYLSVGVVALGLFLALVAFLITGSVWAAGVFAGSPVLVFAAQLINTARSRSSRSDGAQG